MTFLVQVISILVFQRIYGVMEICSIILHIIVYAKIYRYKRQGPDVKPINIFQNKSINISQTRPISKSAESQSLLGLGINIVLIGILTLTSFINVKISKLVKTYNHLRFSLRRKKINFRERETSNKIL